MDEEKESPRLTRSESFARAPAPEPAEVPPVDLDEVRRGVLDLAASDQLDKASALAVTRLFHAMETLLKHECTTRDRALAETRNELERTMLQNELDRMARRRTLDEQQIVGEPTPRGRTTRRGW